MTADEQQFKRFLPLSESAGYVLGSLIPGPRHGYAIGKEVQRLSDGSVSIAVGNLYPMLDRLVHQGLIEKQGEDEQGRLLYELTGVGQSVLEADLRRLTRRIQTVGALKPAIGASLLTIGVSLA